MVVVAVVVVVVIFAVEVEVADMVGVAKAGRVIGAVDALAVVAAVEVEVEVEVEAVLIVVIFVHSFWRSLTSSSGGIPKTILFSRGAQCDESALSLIFL